MDTYENKYKEALEWARKVMQGKVGFVLDEVLEKFPELKESEDAKIRKVISDILLIDSDEIREILDANNVLMQNIDAWLEKQAEKKPVDKIDSSKIKKDPNPYWTLAPEYQLANKQKIADKVGPKFKIGDLITNGILVGKIDEIHELGYHAYFGDHYADVPDAENWHKWTIQDAKDGDVLTTDTWTFIFKKYQDKSVYYHCAVSTFNNFSISDTGEFDSNYVHPTTKEQRDLLFKKMYEAGYEWDAENKQLKKIEQKTAWNEEDYNEIETIACHLDNTDNEGMAEVLRNIRDKYYHIIPQTTWKPSDEQMNTLEHYMHTLICNKHKEILFGLYTDLKKLREE